MHIKNRNKVYDKITSEKTKENVHTIIRLHNPRPSGIWTEEGNVQEDWPWDEGKGK